MTLKKTTIALLVVAAFAPPFALGARAQAQDYSTAQAPTRAFSQAELDQMLAPVALYPDALLSQVLMAAIYPIEVVEAARWTRANPGLKGDDAVRAAQNQDWDPSVQSLVAFPQILQRMDEQLNWTESLGDAFLAQEPAVMDTVQQLRRRAQAAGNLRSSEQIRVVQEGPVIYVRPARPQVVYVPYYDPLVVYGDWWWPAYRPVYWAPWAGYARPRPAPGISVGFWFGSPVGISANFFFGDVDWGRRSVRVVHPTAYYYRPPRVIVSNATVINRSMNVDRNAWQHDPHHRRGADYRQAAPAVQAAPAAQAAARAQPREARREAQEPRQHQQQRDTRQDDRRQREQTLAAERTQRQQQQQQREQAQAAERAQRQQQQQHRQQTEAARAQQQAQRQQGEAAHAQQQQQRQQARGERRDERKEQHEERKDQRSERGSGKGGERS